MKRNAYIFLTMALVVASCNTDEVRYDASGVFEATEVVSAPRHKARY